MIMLHGASCDSRPVGFQPHSTFAELGCRRNSAPCQPRVTTRKCILCTLGKGVRESNHSRTALDVSGIAGYRREAGQDEWRTGKRTPRNSGTAVRSQSGDADQKLRQLIRKILRHLMPTMRQVAVALRIDLNTVRHAYDALARTGALTIQPARGTFIAERPPLNDLSAQTALLDDLAQRTIASARANGIDPIEVAQRIRDIEGQQEDHR
jgi:GntR family transcriptional regulator